MELAITSGTKIQSNRVNIDVYTKWRLVTYLLDAGLHQIRWKHVPKVRNNIEMLFLL